MAPIRIAALAVGLMLVTAHPARAAQVQVVPPGQEGLILDMLGKGVELPGGCLLTGARVLRTHVAATWGCSGVERALELQSLDATGPLVVRTAKLAVVSADAGDPARALADAVAARVREREDRWHWMSVRAESEPVGRLVPTTPPPATEAEGRDIDPAVMASYEKGRVLQTEGRHQDAIDAFVQVARTNPRLGGVLGMIVSNVAQTHPDAAHVARWVAAAQAAPGDPLPAFIAGVGSHYSAHYGASTPEQKRALYEQAIHWLEQAEGPFSFEPRVYIYLAVSHYRLGHQEQAEAAIAKAIALDQNDPDAFYCRAEIRHRVAPAEAIGDLDRYLEMAKLLAEPGSPVAEAKMERVRAMRAHLEDVLAGRADPDELFDPLATASTDEDAPSDLAEAMRSSSLFTWVILAAALLGLGVPWALSRRRRHHKRP